MNLDEFIVADNIATPTGIAGSPSPDLNKQVEDRPIRRQINAIPIKHRQASLPHFVPQSVPVPAHAPSAQHEFGYITRRHRKTSIDDRRAVGDIFLVLAASDWIAPFGPPPSPARYVELDDS